MHPVVAVKNLGIWFDANLMLIPPSLFNEYGDMRKGPKNIQLKKLASTVSNPLVPDRAYVVFDKYMSGSQMNGKRKATRPQTHSGLSTSKSRRMIKTRST